MIDQGVTWIVAADAAHVRVFEERLRAGDVRELPAEAMQIEPADRPRAHAHAGTVHDRHGHGRHGLGETVTAEDAEGRFLARVADTLHARALGGAFDHLVIMAAPTALGLLRARLTGALAAKLEATDPHNRIHDGAEAIRSHLRQARARA